MMPALFLPAGVLALGGYLAQHLSAQHYQRNRQQLVALEGIRGLRQLLEKIPQHRGMANGLLQGDASFAVKLQGLQQQIDRDANILTTLSTRAPCLAAERRIQRIERQWSDIKRDLQQLSPAQSFTLHSELVGEILYLINDLGEEYALLDAHSDFAYLANAAINLLPLVTETQGQARGMATGAATRKACDIPLQVKLRYLIERTRDAIGKAKGGLQGKPEAGGLDESVAATESFLQLLETQILNVESIDIAPDKVFVAGTQAINKSFALLDQLIAALQQRLLTETTHSQRRWRMSQVTAAGLLVPTVWLVHLAV